MTDDLTIPAFLDKRNKEPTMPRDTPELHGTTAIPTHEAAPAEPELPTIDMIMEQIKKLSARRDEITSTLSGLKKQAQKMIGQL